MSTSAPLDRNDPTMLAWNAFRETEEYANAARWAISPQDTAGSLWCAFAAGFAALRALSSEQGSYTWEEFQRISAERDSEQRWAKEYHDKWQAAERRAEEAEREIKRIAVIVANLSEEWGRVDTAARVAALDWLHKGAVS